MKRCGACNKLRKNLDQICTNLVYTDQDSVLSSDHKQWSELCTDCIDLEHAINLYNMYYYRFPNGTYWHPFPWRLRRCMDKSEGYYIQTGKGFYLETTKVSKKRSMRIVDYINARWKDDEKVLSQKEK